MKHKNEENLIESGSDEIVIDINNCTDNPSQNRDNIMDVFSINMMGATKKGKSSILNTSLRDIMSNSKESTKNGCYDEIDIEEEDQPRIPAPSRRRAKGTSQK